MPAKPGSDQVQELYDLARSAAVSRQQLDSAVKGFRVQEYHRVLREHPEVNHLEPLSLVRRQIGDLVEEKRRVDKMQNLTDDERSIQSEQVDAAIAQIAAGGIMWVKERMSGHGEFAESNLTASSSKYISPIETPDMASMIAAMPPDEPVQGLPQELPRQESLPPQPAMP